MSNDPRDYQDYCDMCGNKVWASEANAHDCPTVLCANNSCNRPFIPSFEEICCSQCGNTTTDDVVLHYMDWLLHTCENPFEELMSIYDYLPQHVKTQWLDTFLEHTSNE
jgi:hypothetical protein